MTKYYLEIIDRDIEKRITRVGVIDVHSKQFLGAIYVKVLDEDDPLMIQYEKKKDQFIDNMKAGDLQKAKQDFKALAKKLYDEIDTEIFKTKKQRTTYIMSKFANYTTKEIDIISTFLEILLSSGKHALDEENEGFKLLILTKTTI